MPQPASIALGSPAGGGSRLGGVAMSVDPGKLDRDHLWHPFTQQQAWSEEGPLLIERAEGTHLIDSDGRRYIDGVSSLWCNVHGHRHSGIDEALREQLDRVAHSTMLGLSHPGAAELAARLVPPPAFLGPARGLCARLGVLLVGEGVATGLGRPGTMFACQQEGVAPDLLCLAKGLPGGYLPLAATLTTERIYEGFLGAPEDQRTFFHGHTYTGNPLACAAALASLEAFERERTLERLQPKIELLGEQLDAVAAMPEVAEVRQCGFMVGIDLGEHDPALRLGHRITLEARKRGAIVRPLSDVVVLMPPLSISEVELRHLVEITGESIRAACASVEPTAAPLARAA